MIFLTILQTIAAVLLGFLYFTKTSKAVLGLLVPILFVLSAYLLVYHFDKGLLSLSTMDTVKMLQRQQFYHSELGRIYGNRFGQYYFDNLSIVFEKASNNFFSALDLKRYFSSIFPIYFAPFFIVGFLFVLKNFKKIFLVYLVPGLFIGSLINFDDDARFILIFPFIIFCLIVGFIEIIRLIKKV